MCGKSRVMGVSTLVPDIYLLKSSMFGEQTPGTPSSIIILNGGVEISGPRASALFSTL